MWQLELQKPSWSRRGPDRQKPHAWWQSGKIEGSLVLKAMHLWYQPWAAYLWISLKCERSTLLFSLLHCYFVLQLYAAELNVNWYIWLIRPRVMIWPQRSSLTLSCAPVPTPDHCLFPALVCCQFLEPLPTSGPSLLSSSAWNSLLLLCLANSCHFSDPSLKCHLLAENFSDSLI